MADVKEMIMNGKTALGIEFGSTNIKAVLIDEEGTVLATGSYGFGDRKPPAQEKEQRAD